MLSTATLPTGKSRGMSMASATSRGSATEVILRKVRQPWVQAWKGGVAWGGVGEIVMGWVAPCAGVMRWQSEVGEEVSCRAHGYKPCLNPAVTVYLRQPGSGYLLRGS
jgi:hypothetical protein